MKKCTKCGEELPATLEFFYKEKWGKFGLKSKCKKCTNKYHKQWYEDNKESTLEYAKQYREDNKESLAEYNKKWKKDNPEKIRAKNSKRRALKAGATVENFTPQDVLDKWGTDCHICKKSIDLFDWHQDHVVPLSKGGEHSLANVKPSHPYCNLVKGNKSANICY